MEVGAGVRNVQRKINTRIAEQEGGRRLDLSEPGDSTTKRRVLKWLREREKTCFFFRR